MENAIDVVVFDVGGTLMEYVGMPHSWVGYYCAAFEAVRRKLKIDLTDEDIEKSCEILAHYNPRVHYREVEYTPRYIFERVTEYWHCHVELDLILKVFFEGFRLRATVYDETLATLRYLRETAFHMAALTDLPTAMPDECFKRDISSFIDELDYYVSSLSCGFRKPNKAGLMQIAEHFKTTPNRMVFVGDEEKDIKTAQNAGVKSVLICRDKIVCKCFGQDYTIAALGELKKIIIR
jgi:haloacid dehalogenase superfamily, subfamily IA, variant 1 with third motif having Dx(3-4)D or Dx(3-4)E